MDGVVWFSRNIRGNLKHPFNTQSELDDSESLDRKLDRDTSVLYCFQPVFSATSAPPLVVWKGCSPQRTSDGPGEKRGSTRRKQTLQQFLWKNITPWSIHLNTSQASLSDARVILPVALYVMCQQSLSLESHPKSPPCLKILPEKQQHRRNTTDRLSFKHLWKNVLLCSWYTLKIT